MADPVETVDVLQSDEAVSASTAAMATYQSVGSSYVQGALVSSNAAVPPKSTPLVQLPQLQESEATGYVVEGKRPNLKSVKKQITLCTVGKFLVEKNTAYDYIMMATAAAKDGISLPIVAGYRTWEYQNKLYIERQNPAVAAELGIAAKPGFSNHQSGIALDIYVGMTKPMYIARQLTAAYIWMAGDSEIGGTRKGFAEEFGFDHKEGAAVDEPWHWTHWSYKIVGTQAFQSSTGFEVLTADTAVAAGNANQSGIARVAWAGIHDETVGASRARAMSRSSRGTLFTAQSIHQANMSNGVGEQVSRATAATTLEAEPATFVEGSLGAFSYDFSTGLWGDGKPV